MASIRSNPVRPPNSAGPNLVMQAAMQAAVKRSSNWRLDRRLEAATADMDGLRKGALILGNAVVPVALAGVSAIGYSMRDGVASLIEGAAQVLTDGGIPFAVAMLVTLVLVSAKKTRLSNKMEKEKTKEITSLNGNLKDARKLIRKLDEQVTGASDPQQRERNMIENFGRTLELMGSSLANITFDYRHVILRRIEGGGMAFVLKVFDTTMKRTVAWKIPRFPLSKDEIDEVLSRFAGAEAIAMSKMNHPRIVRCLDLREDMDHTMYERLTGVSLAGRQHIPAKIPYMVNEWVFHPDLEEVLIAEESRGNQGLSTDLALKLAIATAEGFSKAKEQGIVHRDLKPANLFVLPDPDKPEEKTTKINDFGLAKIQRGSDKTEAGKVFGTIAYMSPEQLRSATNVDWRTDQYALGATLYEMFTGEPPYGVLYADDSVATYMAMISRDPIPDITQKAYLPPKAVAVVNRMLAKSFVERYDSWEDCINDLREALREVQELQQAETGDLGEIDAGAEIEVEAG